MLSSSVRGAFLHRPLLAGLVFQMFFQFFHKAVALLCPLLKQIFRRVSWAFSTAVS
jgi:hypothetical protein